MKERIDNFMKVVRERYDGTNTKANGRWEQLYKTLKGILPSKDKEELEKQWYDHQQTLKLEQWDMDFGELLLGGDREEVVEVKGIDVSPEHYIDSMRELYKTFLHK